MRKDPEIVLAVITRLGTARLENICKETGWSRSTVSRLILRLRKSKGITKSGHGWTPASGSKSGSNPESGSGLLKTNNSPSGIDISRAKKNEDMLGIGAVKERSTSATPARLGGGGQCVAATEDKTEHPSVPATMRYVIDRIIRDRRRDNQKEGMAHVKDPEHQMKLWNKRKLVELERVSDDLLVVGAHGRWTKDRVEMCRRADALVPEWREWMRWAVRDMARQESRRRTKAVNDAFERAAEDSRMYPDGEQFLGDEPVEQPVQAALKGPPTGRQHEEPVALGARA
jgi:hypothetical protein